jgi:uncharacterized protein YbaP (TraB family)
MRLFLAVAFLLATIGAAAAAPPTCTGADLLEAMRHDHPETYATLRAEADAVPNGKGLVWKIESQKAVAPSYLFGTVHLTDDRVQRLPAAAETALAKAETVVIESTEAVNAQEMAKHVFRVATLMVLPDDTTLDEVIPAADLPLVKAYFDEKGSGFESVLKYRPYMAALALAFPQCEAARQLAGLLSLDAAIAERTGEAGARLDGLETLVEQFGSMAAMPMDEQAEWLVQAVKFAAMIDDITETMVRLYLAQETGLLLVWSKDLAKETGTEKSWASFEKLLVEARNRRMAERAISFIERGNAFIAVGALHLPGETGLVQLLREEGYTLTPIH